VEVRLEDTGEVTFGGRRVVVKAVRAVGANVSGVIRLTGPSEIAAIACSGIALGARSRVVVRGVDDGKLTGRSEVGVVTCSGSALEARSRVAASRGQWWSVSRRRRSEGAHRRGTLAHLRVPLHLPG
jgi:hypothetical protein